jgi:hypothetical protein
VKIAYVIGKAVWDQKADIRDVISIGRLVRKNDGPEEVERILSTMTSPFTKLKHDAMAHLSDQPIALDSVDRYTYRYDHGQCQKLASTEGVQ